MKAAGLSLCLAVVSLCRYNQINALSIACSNGLEDCLTLTTGWFRQLMDNPADNK